MFYILQEVTTITQCGNNMAPFIEGVQASWPEEVFSVQFVEILQFSSWIWDYLLKEKSRSFIISCLIIVAHLLTKEDKTVFVY